MARIVGTDEPETITGTSEGDYIVGLGGDDHILGLDGGDKLFGGGGADILEGGLGDDIYEVFDDLSDTIIDIGGTEILRTTVGADLQNYPDIEILGMVANAGGRPLYGNGLDNQLSDGAGSNLLDGREGDDYLLADLGNDILVGGLGHDIMTGGDGSDRFDFRSADEIGLGEGNRDHVSDFRQRADKLNLGLMDANSEHSGNQSFRFIGAAEFSGRVGELAYHHATSSDQFSQPLTIVAGDIDGDGNADFEIELRGTLTLHTVDFIL